METINELKHTLEAILFVAGKPLKAKDLAKILRLEEKNIQEALTALAEETKNSGIVLLDNKGEYQFSTNSKYSTQVKNFLNAELREKLTDATVEVLAIIAYRQPISKAEIEAIRGVNSQYSLRNLLIRGLIEKVTNPADARSFLYQTTTEFLMHLGLNSVNGLPEFEKLVAQIKLPETPELASSAEEAQIPETPKVEPVINQSVVVAPEIVAQTPEPVAEVPAKNQNSQPEENEAEDEFEDDEDDDESDEDEE